MDYKLVRKKVIKEGVIIASVLAALGAGLFFLDDFSGDYDRKVKELEGKVTGITTETSQLNEKYAKVRKNINVYKEAMEKFEHGGLTISRPQLREKFNSYRTQYHLDNLKLTMASVEDATDAKYKRNTLAIVQSEVTISFDAVSDEDVYALLTAMFRDLSGSIKIKQFALTRSADLTDDVLHQISQQGFARLIKGDLKLTWFGLRTIDADETALAKKH